MRKLLFFFFGRPIRYFLFVRMRGISFTEIFIWAFINMVIGFMIARYFYMN
jgi:hypothetical protein